MRILAVSDLRVQGVRLLEQVARDVQPDLILYAGDDVARFGQEPNSWAPLAARTPLGLAGVIGNDCRRDHAVAFDQPGCHDLDRAPLLLDGLAILGLGGAPRDGAGGIGYTLYSRKQAARHLERQVAAAGRRKILLVSHAPPLGVLDVGIRYGVRSIGSSVVRDFLGRPAVRGVVCGHVHSQGGQIANLGRKVVVNIASHDSPGAPLRYAVLEWDGASFTASVCKAAAVTGGMMGVHGIGPATAARLHGHGFRNMADLLDGDGGELARVVGVAPGRRIRAHARALREGRPVLIAPEEPFPAGALIMDVETSLRLDDPWLVAIKPWGLAAVRQYQELNATRHDAHLTKVGKAILRQRWSCLVQWGTFDRGALERAHRRVRLVPPAWLRKDAWLDACAWLRRVVALPIGSNDLKSVAEYFKYSFAVSGVDGFTAGVLYTRYRSEGVKFDIARLRAYNRDDVIAVEHVVRAVQSLAQVPIRWTVPPGRSQFSLDIGIPGPRVGWGGKPPDWDRRFGRRRAGAAGRCSVLRSPTMVADERATPPGR